MKKSVILIILWFHLSQIVSFSQTVETKKRCIDCHSQIINQPFIHMDAIDECENCHLQNTNEHPAAGVQGFSLVSEIPELCYNCHDKGSKKNLHSPAKEGECLICHSPHASANKSLLLNDRPRICSDCHELDIENKKFKHLPVFDGNCHTCHDPHQSDYDYFLKEEKSNLCMSCHEKTKAEAGLKNIHPPFIDDCANCHSTHGADNEKLLTKQSPDLCYTCHTELQTRIENSAIIHKAISESKGCANCHSPHASNQEKYLFLEEKELCLTCHNKIILTDRDPIQNIQKMLKKGNFIHAAIENGGCTVCHDPHSSGNLLLVKENYSTKQYTDGNSNNFALCFSCHDSDLMDNETDTTKTNFRNGPTNLHFLHLKGDNRYNCNLCHNIHGSIFEHLISNKVKFGNWEMPLKFNTIENGGNCNTGCHEERSYFR